MSDIQSLTSIVVSAAIWWLLVAAVSVANRARTKEVEVGQTH
jgi:hypothetical protein